MAFVGIVVLSRPQVTPTPPPAAQTTPTVFAAVDIPLGTRVTTAMVRQQELRNTERSETAFQSTSLVVGKVIRRSVVQGAQLTAADFQVIENGSKREVTRASLGNAPLRIVLMVDSSTPVAPMLNGFRTAVNLESLAQWKALSAVVPAHFVKIRGEARCSGDNEGGDEAILQAIRNRAPLVLTRLEHKTVAPADALVQGYAYGLPAQRAAVAGPERFALKRFAGERGARRKSRPQGARRRPSPGFTLPPQPSQTWGSRRRYSRVKPQPVDDAACGWAGNAPPGDRSGGPAAHRRRDRSPADVAVRSRCTG